MMQPITILGLTLTLAMLFLRYRIARSRPRRRRPRHIVMLVKVLLLALIAWLTVSSNLAHMLDNADGTPHQPTALERVVAFLSK